MVRADRRVPDDAELSRQLGRRAVKPTSVSLVEPFRALVLKWWNEGIQGTTIHAALVRDHGSRGSYSSVRRFLAGVEGAYPRVTTVLECEPRTFVTVDERVVSNYRCRICCGEVEQVRLRIDVLLSRESQPRFEYGHILDPLSPTMLSQLKSMNRENLGLTEPNRLRHLASVRNVFR